MEDGALADGELADGELADGEMEDAEVEEEMGVLWETIQDWDIKKMNIGAKRKAITGLVLNGNYVIYLYLKYINEYDSTCLTIALVMISVDCYSLNV